MAKKPKPLSPYAPRSTPFTYEQWAPSGGNPYIVRELSDRELVNQYKEIYSSSDLPAIMTRFASKFPNDPDIALSLAKAGVSEDAANAASRLNNILGTEETYNSVVKNQRGSNIDYHNYLAALNTDDENADDADKDDAAWFAGIKTGVRSGLAGAFTPLELLGNVVRQADGAWNKARQNGMFGGDNEGEDNIVVGGDQAFDPTAIVRSTTLWQNLVENKSIGTGFVPGGDAVEAKEEVASRVAQIRSRKTGKLSFYTPGRAAASISGLDPEETAYSTMSGIIDAVVALRLDPLVVLGRMKNAKNLEKSAQELRDAKAAGMDAQEIARIAKKHAEDTAKMIDTDALNASKARNLAEDELKAVYEKISNERIQFDQLLTEGAVAAQPKSVQNAIKKSGINQQIETRKTLLQTLEDQKKLATGLVPDPLRDGLPMSKANSIKYLEEEVKGIELSINQSLDSIHINRSKKVRDLIAVKQAVLAERTQEFADTVRQSQKIASPAERKAFIESERAGLIKTSDGYKLNRDIAVQWMFDKNADEVLNRIADVKSPSEIIRLSKGKFAPSFAKELAAADNIDDVEALLMGRINVDVIKSVPRNSLARYVVNKNPNFIFGDPVRAPKTDKFSNTFRYLKSQLPSMGEVHLQNTDELVKQTTNWMIAARWGVKEIDEVVDNLLSTDEISYVERQNIITGMLDRTVSKYAEEQNLPAGIKSKLTDFTTAYKSSLSGLRQYSSEVIDESFGSVAIINGETIDLTGLPTSIAQLANTIAFPNVARVRELTGIVARASRSVDNLVSSNSRYAERSTFMAARVIRDSNDGFLRNILLVGRGAFMIRNIMEMQVRMYLAGGIGLFSNPVAFIGLMMSNPKSAKALMAKAADVDPYLVDISGKAFVKMAKGDAKGTQDAWNSFINTMTERGFSMDGRAVRGAMRDGSFSLIKLDDDSRNVTAYADGIASRLLLHHADPMKRMIATQNQAGLPSALRVAIREGRMTYEQAVVAAVRDGLFKNQVDILSKSVPKLQKLLSTEKGIHTLLFGDGFRSYSKEITDETLGITELRNFINTGKITQSTEKIVDGKVIIEEKELFSLTTDFVKNQKQLSKYIKNQIINDPEMANRASQVAVPAIKKIAENDNVVAFSYAKFADAFFRTSSRLEVRTVYSPEYRVSYWNAVADMAPLLSKEAAQKILQEAFDIRKTKVAIENADGTITYEKWTKNNPAFERIVEASKSNNGKMTYDDINEYAQSQASKRIAKLFYDATNKNNFSYAAQLVYPFINAWGNTIKKWGELTANPANAAARVTPAVRVFENLQTPESANLYDITGTPHDPTQGFIWEDQYGEKVFTIPLSGNLKTLFGLIGGDPRSGDISIPVSSLNLAFSGAHIPGSSIGILPGVGTVWNIAYSVLDNDIKKDVPEVLANWIAPYGDKTGNVIAPAPAWLTKMWRGFVNDEAAFVKLAKPIMVWEATNNPEFRPLYDGTPLSLEDRAALQEKLAARGMSGARYQYFMQGILQNVSPGTPVYQYYAKNENGDTFMQWQMQEAFNKIVGANNGNYDLAWNEYSTVFGREAVMAAMGQTKDAVFANNEAWEFAKKNQSLFDSYNGVIPYFFTGGDFSTEYKRSMERRGRGDVLTAKELTTEADRNILAAVRGNLAVEAVNNGYSAEWIDSEMQKYKMDVLQGYEPEISITSNKTEQKILQIQSALTHEEFSTTDAGSAALSYFSARDQALADSKMFYPDRSTPSLSGNDNAENRNWLRQVADQLSQGNPDFKNMYQRVLSQELREQ